MASKGFRSWLWQDLINQVRSCCDIDPVKGCWVYRFGKDKDGYAKLYIDGKHWRVSRAVLFVVTGELHPHAMHTCDNPPCCYPEHLKWGTAKVNVEDCHAKGRAATRNLPTKSGTENSNAKLSEDDIRQILEMDDMASPELAEVFGVHEATIQRVRKEHGRAWDRGRPRTLPAKVIKSQFELEDQFDELV